MLALTLVVVVAVACALAAVVVVVADVVADVAVAPNVAVVAAMATVINKGSVLLILLFKPLKVDALAAAVVFRLLVPLDVLGVRLLATVLVLRMFLKPLVNSLMFQVVVLLLSFLSSWPRIIVIITMDRSADLLLISVIMNLLRILRRAAVTIIAHCDPGTYAGSSSQAEQGGSAEAQEEEAPADECHFLQDFGH